jgi:peptidoglycan/LPS O-acetylase OafA/YrhL
VTALAPADTPNRRLASIDCLRGVAVLAVLMHHVFRMSFPAKSFFWIQEWVEATGLGVRGVALFFVISGFCIHMPWARRMAAGESSRVSFLPFWRRRLWRLYPPYFVALTAGLFLILFLALIGKTGAVTPDYFPQEPQRVVYDYVAHLLMLHGFHPEFDSAGSNPAFWTLAREEYLYLLYFALLFCRTRWSAWLSTFAALVAGVGFRMLMAAIMGEHRYGFSLVSSSAIVLWVQWALGMLAVEGALGLVRLPAWTRQLALVPVWIGISFYADGHAVTLSPLCWGMTFFTLVNWATTKDLAGRWPVTRGVEWLRRTGVISYSIYLTHWPAVWLAFIVIRVAFGRAALTPNKPEYFAQLAFLTCVGYGSGWAYFRLVERHFLNKREDADPADTTIHASVVAEPV